jgi:hypothetical protein
MNIGRGREATKPAWMTAGALLVLDHLPSMRNWSTM